MITWPTIVLQGYRGLLAGCVLLGSVLPLPAQVRMTKDEALLRYFPDADVKRATAFLSPEQVERIQQQARTRVESRVLTYYTARKNGSLAGTAFFETQTVRTMPVTYLTVIDPDTSVRAVEILAFHEPEDYAPPGRWLAQFAGKTGEDDLFLKRGIQNIAGATMTAQSLSNGIRRLIASYTIVVVPLLEDR